MDIGNIGVITTRGEELHQIIAICDDIVYCVPLNKSKVHLCFVHEFWVLLDKLP